PGAGGDWIAAKGGGMHAGAETGSHFWFDEHRRAGNATADGFGERHDVGDDIEMLVGEPAPRAAAAGLHFIEDEQQVVFVAEPAESGQELGGREVDAPFAFRSAA